MKRQKADEKLPGTPTSGASFTSQATVYTRPHNHMSVYTTHTKREREGERAENEKKKKSVHIFVCVCLCAVECEPDSS